MEDEQEFTFKKNTSDLANNINCYLPLIEEITIAGMIPMCVIGIKIKDEEKKQFSAHFATHNDAQDDMLYDICKVFIKAYDEKTIKKI